MKWDETSIIVRFNEVDSYQVAWHGQYVGWMEVGRLHLSHRFGLAPSHLMELGYVGPVVQLEVKYLQPARYNDTLIIRTTLVPTDAATLVFLSEIVGVDGVRFATGRVVHALTDTAGVLQFKLPLVIAERIGQMQASLHEVVL
jgi:acyl-CoA thioester hydrolase